MDIRQYGLVVVLAVLSACSSANAEAIKRQGVIDLPRVDPNVEHEADDEDVPQPRRDNRKRLNAAWCYEKWRSSKISERAVVVKAAMPVFDLDTLRFVQPQLGAAFVSGIESPEEKLIRFTDNRDGQLTFGPFVGRFAIVGANDATLETLATFTEHLSRNGFSWKWRRTSESTWMSNLLGVVFTADGTLLVTDVEAFVIGEPVIEGTLIPVDRFEMMLSDKNLVHPLLAPFFRGHHQGTVTFLPLSVGLALDGKLASCAHIGPYPAFGFRGDAWKE